MKHGKPLIVILAMALALGSASACSAPRAPSPETTGAVTPGSAAGGEAAGPGEVRTFTHFISGTWAKMPPKDSPVMTQLRDLYGVEIEWIVPSSDPNERLSIMLASNDQEMPDLITFYDVTMMEQYKKAGKLLKLNGYLEQYCPDVVRINFKRFYNRLKDESGGIYFLPTAYNANSAEYNSPEARAGLWMKSDFFDQNGWEAGNPQTLSEVKDVLHKVKAAYPEQAAISLALGAQGELEAVIGFGVGAAGLVENGLSGSDYVILNQDGSLQHFSENEQMKGYFKFLNSLHLEGLLDIESPMLSADALQQKVVGDQVFAAIFNSFGIRDAYNSYQASIGTDDQMFFLYPKSDESVKQVTHARRPLDMYSVGLSVTAAMEAPEDFFKFYAQTNTEAGNYNTIGIVNWEFEGENTVEATEGYNRATRS